MPDIIKAHIKHCEMSVFRECDADIADAYRSYLVPRYEKRMDFTQPQHLSTENHRLVGYLVLTDSENFESLTEL